MIQAEHNRKDCTKFIFQRQQKAVKKFKKNSNTGCAMSRLNSKQIQRIPGAKPATDTKVQVKKLYLGLLTPSVLSPTSNFPIYF